MSRTRWAASLLLLTSLVGCPEPVTSDAPSAGGAGPGGAGVGGGQGAKTGDGMMGSPPTQAPSAGGAGAPGAIPDADLEPKFEQAELADGATISGTLVCADCKGSLLVRVLPPPPDQGGAEEGIVLITTKSFDAAGEFSIKVPKDRPSVVLQIVEDADGDGKPSAGERMGIPVDGPVTVQAEVTGVTLEVGVFPQMGAMDGQGSQINTPPEGVPNPTPPGAGGAGAGGEAPAGGAGGDGGGVPALPDGPAAEGAPPVNAGGAAPPAPE